MSNVQKEGFVNMNFKKIIALTASLTLCAGLLTACGGDDKAPGSETVSESETTSAASASETTAVSEEMSDSESESEAEGDFMEDPSANGIGTDKDEVSNNPLMPLVNAATSVGEWPTLWEVTDTQMLSDFFLLDAENENYKNLIAVQCPMSANMTEIIIIEADDVDAAKTDLEARQKKAKEQDAFYPDDVDKAEASIIGSEGNYAYFILAYDASEAETALVEAIKAL